jgi:ethanolamine ammonia-lyase large subunit
MFSRRSFIRTMAGGVATVPLGLLNSVAVVHADEKPMPLSKPRPKEDVFSYLKRVNGQFDNTIYARILGAANEFKEGDQFVGVAAANASSRQFARTLLANTRIEDLEKHCVFQDQLQRLIQPKAVSGPDLRTLADLKQFLLVSTEEEIKIRMPAWSSDTIACVTKLMSNADLIKIGAKVFNPLPGSKIGAKGYLGARVQPNSPTDNVHDIRWQVFDAFSYAVGDVLLGTNPVSSEANSVAAVQRTLKDILKTFGISDLMPHCVLSHIDVQAEVEEKQAESTALWFQSIAGSDSANKTFDISIKKMLDYAERRTGKYGLYFETGQGADFTNGHAHGFDMVMHESRKYGFARTLTYAVERAQKQSDRKREPWVHLNDVAGFIGPEVFRSKEQLVRCCLEDIVMGKLHGLCIGLDVCSTLHMDVSLEDLDWCLDEIMPANPAYLMALPTKIDPMLGYLTTGYQDHVRLREKFCFKVNDAMWSFFQSLGVIDARGKPTKRFGDPSWVYLQYARRKADKRSDSEILKEANDRIRGVRQRGVFIADGHGDNVWDLKPALKKEITNIYNDAKKSIFAEVSDKFVESIPNVVPIKTQSTNRTDYIQHPDTGERLSKRSAQILQEIRTEQRGRFDVQIVISDGLNAHAISDDGHLDPFLKAVRANLKTIGMSPSPDHIFVTTGRVRAGYRIGESLFAKLKDQRAILHIIGERPGTGHHTFSVYITAPDASVWSKVNEVDHNITKVVSGVASTALQPILAAQQVADLLSNI